MFLKTALDITIPAPPGGGGGARPIYVTLGDSHWLRDHVTNGSNSPFWVSRIIWKALWSFCHSKAKSDRETKHHLWTISTTYVEESIQGVKIVWLIVKMVVQEGEDAGLQEDGVVDGHRADVLALVPARLSAASGRAVHHVVSDEEEWL